MSAAVACPQMARSPSAESIGTERQQRDREQPVGAEEAPPAEGSSGAEAPERQLQQGDGLQSPTAAAPAADVQAVPVDDVVAQAQPARSQSADAVAAQMSPAQVHDPSRILSSTLFGRRHALSCGASVRKQHRHSAVA